MKVLVTGGAGFIGANFIEYLLREHPGDDVVCLDALTYAGHLITLEGAMRSERFAFVHGDITDQALVMQLFEEHRPDVVVNFAAESHVDRSILAPDVFLRTNILGTHALLEACRTVGVGRFHQVSTDEVYGDLPLDRPDLLFTEDTPLKTSSPYSASKASADLLVHAYARTFGVPCSISRCSNNYGPYQLPEKLIPRMISLALRDEAVPIYGEGANVRDWLYAPDHCRAIDLIVRKGADGAVYNVGGNNERSNLQVARTVLAYLGKPESLIQFVPDRPGHDLRYAIDASKISAELGWSPEVTFDDGIRSTVAWYAENTDWMEKVQ